AIEPLLPSLYLGTSLLPQLPELTGVHGPRTYLLVVQNSDELRATGGFISALGVITLEQGRLANLEFVDSYRLYHEDQSYPPAPPPMNQFMNIPYLLFRDANWSPDFPTTATLLRAIYRQETGVTVDGIVTVDLHALELIVGALAPLPMANAPEALTGANVVDFVKDMWAQPEEGETITEVGLGQWWGQRKNFIPALAEALMAKLRSGRIDYIAVAMAAEQALNERAIQIWLADETAAAQLARLGWDGGLQVRKGADYLSLIDTNMGYNKANAVIERSLAYSVTWPTAPTEPAVATVTITYRHPLTLPNHDCDLTPRYGDDYDDLVERCFFNYVRLYVPNGSRLLSTAGLQEDSVNTTRGEDGTQIFAGYFVLPPGETTHVRVQYQLPATLTPETYQLLIQRQAGSGPLPLQVTVGDGQLRTTLHNNTLLWSVP
ncbi:MAG: DUF4012 domain-containing protein, partial [Caldilineaceae bacterium]|nr:DUF4012 domain-containing protein [Caldilineaceae bacterium]